MKEFKGTKGSWSLLEIDNKKLTYRFYIKSEDGISITKIARNNRDVEVDKANAKLIAAAPELLEALQLCVDRLNWNEVKTSEVYDKAKQAISKALS